MNKKLWVQRDVSMTPCTLDEARWLFTYVLLFKGDKMYCKKYWYECWVEVPLKMKNNKEVK